MDYPRGLHPIQAQKKLHIQREIVEFKQVVAFEMESKGAVEQIGVDGNNLRIVETRPKRYLLGAMREVHPIDDRGLLFSHASPFEARQRAEYSSHANKSKRIV